MAKHDQNLDAYRLAAAVLTRLRALLRRHLEATHGATWESDGIPDETRLYLTQRRDREAAVKWNAATGVDLLDFGGFVNLCDVLNNHPRLRDGFSRLVPDPNALRLRFLELDTVLNRITYARPVSESDLELLLGFDERLRALAADLPVGAAGAVDEAEEVEPPVKPAKRAAPAEKPFREAPAPQAAPTPEIEAVPVVTPAAPAAEAPAAAPAPQAPSHAAKAHAPEPRERPTHGQDGGHGHPATGSIPAVPTREGQGSAPSKEFEAALRRGDDSAVLSALYQEITNLAEKIWGETGTARSPVWEAVRESTWYESRFSALRLRVVSDFYDLLRNVQERTAAGTSRTDLHEFLKERNFAQLLMELREFFRPIATAARQRR
jgi:hypothetical protein